MNHFFYESRGKEKVRELRNEGMRSQTFHRSGLPRLGLLRNLPKLVLIFLGLLGILNLLVH